MYQRDTEMLFPARVIPGLRGLRGPAWKNLVERVSAQPEGEAEALAFGLMMVRLNGCLTCHADCFRALRGCTACAHMSLGRYKDGDETLVGLFQQARTDVATYLTTGQMPEA